MDAKDCKDCIDCKGGKDLKSGFNLEASKELAFDKACIDGKCDIIEDAKCKTKKKCDCADGTDGCDC